MEQVIALTQFVFLTLGWVAVKILTKAQVTDKYLTSDPLAPFFAAHGPWLLVIPGIYLLLVQAFPKGKEGEMTFIRLVGVALTVVIAAFYGFVIFTF